MALKRKINHLIQILIWIVKGRQGSPPYSVKQSVLITLGKEYDLSFFVETGTHSGAMVNAMRGKFDKIYSIELSEKFFNSAKNWFKNDNSVTIIHGDSGVELEGVVKQLTGSALFWLDGHFSAGQTARGDKDTPILEELEHIYADLRFKHVVIIDDARLFGADPAYPTIQEIESCLKAKNVNYKLSIKYDAIRVLPV